MSGAAGGAAPLIRIVRGNPTAAEVAALIVVLAALPRGRRAEPPSGPASGWADRRLALRAPPRPGPDAWRRSARP